MVIGNQFQPHVWDEEDVSKLSRAIKAEMGVTITQAQLERDGGITVKYFHPKTVNEGDVLKFILKFEKSL